MVVCGYCGFDIGHVDNACPVCLPNFRATSGHMAGGKPEADTSVQAAEPAAWGNMADDIHDHDRVLITDKELARKYGEQCYTLVPLHIHPAKTDASVTADLIAVLQRAKEALFNGDYQELTPDELLALIDAELSKAGAA